MNYEMPRLKSLLYNITFFLICLLAFLLVFESQLVVPAWLQVGGRLHGRHVFQQRRFQLAEQRQVNAALRANLQVGAKFGSQSLAQAHAFLQLLLHCVAQFAVFVLSALFRHSSHVSTSFPSTCRKCLNA